MTIYQILYKAYLLKGKKNSISAKIPRLAARSTFLAVGAAYLVIMQIGSQLVWPLKHRKCIISPNAWLSVNFFAHGWLHSWFRRFRRKGLPSLGKETEILHSKSTACIDLSGVVLVLSNPSSLVQSEIGCICMSLQDYQSTPFQKKKKLRPGVLIVVNFTYFR